jgi:hypothetical protein
MAFHFNLLSYILKIASKYIISVPRTKHCRIDAMIYKELSENNIKCVHTIVPLYFYRKRNHQTGYDN